MRFRSEPSTQEGAGQWGTVRYRELRTPAHNGAWSLPSEPEPSSRSLRGWARCLTAEQELALWDARDGALLGGGDARGPRERIAEEYYGLGLRIARQYTRSGVETNDLYQVARWAVYHATKSYDPRKPMEHPKMPGVFKVFSFATFLRTCVRHALVDEIRRERRSRGYSEGGTFRWLASVDALEEGRPQLVGDESARVLGDGYGSVYRSPRKDLVASPHVSAPSTRVSK